MRRGTLRLMPPPSPAAIFARAARLELLACQYGAAGRHDLHLIGVDLAGRVQAIGDRRLAA